MGLLPVGLIDLVALNQSAQIDRDTRDFAYILGFRRSYFA